MKKWQEMFKRESYKLMEYDYNMKEPKESEKNATPQSRRSDKHF